jgi:hypothetical protein
LRRCAAVSSVPPTRTQPVATLPSSAQRRNSSSSACSAAAQIEDSQILRLYGAIGVQHAPPPPGAYAVAPADAFFPVADAAVLVERVGFEIGSESNRTKTLAPIRKIKSG